MLNNYDKMLKNHIASFLKVGKRKIDIYGLQNDEQDGELAFTQAGSEKDKIKFPFLVLIRFPDILITDDSMTKRPANYEGYSLIEDDDRKITLNCMRCELSYALDIYAENKKTTEDLAMQVYFKLRNNPNFNVEIKLPFKDEDGSQLTVSCIPDIVMDGTMSHLKTQDNLSAQLYRLRIKFILKNVNIFDFSEKEVIENINYEILVKLGDSPKWEIL